MIQESDNQQGKDLSAASNDSVTIVVNGQGLNSLEIRPKFLEYVKQLWQRRFFILTDARSRSFQSTRNYRLWRMWLVVNPILDVALYGFVFGVLFRTAYGVENFVGYLFLGIIFMKMINGMITGASGMLSNNRALIRAFSFPRASIPLSFVFRSFLDNLVPAGIAILVAFILQWGTFPRWTLILFLPLYLLLHIFGCGMVFIVSRLTAEIPDAKALIGLFTQALFFLSGVMYSLDRFDHIPIAYQLMARNPTYLFLLSIRESTIYGTVPSFDVWIGLVAWSLGIFLLGFIYFWHAEEKYVRLV